MNRREWISRSARCLAATIWDRGSAFPLEAASDAPEQGAMKAFDHILLGTSDLEKGIQWVEQRTGVRAVIGGVHPGQGTRNALLSLGRLQYLEIIAPDPAQKVDDGFGLAQLASPRLLQWAVHTEDIGALKRLMNASGLKTFGPEPGSRRRPDGRMLRWQTLGVEQTTPLVPFFIQWERGSPHPSADAPLLGQMTSLYFETPQPDELDRILQSAAVHADIRRSAAPHIVLRIETAKGAVEIS